MERKKEKEEWICTMYIVGIEVEGERGGGGEREQEVCFKTYIFDSHDVCSDRNISRFLFLFEK